MRRLMELGAVGLSGALHITWVVMDWSRPVLVVPLIGAWIAYLGVRLADPTALDALGVRMRGWRETATGLAACLVVPAVLMVAYGLSQGFVPPAGAVLGLLVYPIWGFVQQLLFQGMITRNLREYLPLPATVLVSASIFGLIHFAEPRLVVGTFLLGLVFAPLYLRHRNLPALAIAHGWMGTLFYNFVLGRDPLVAYFG